MHMQALRLREREAHTIRYESEPTKAVCTMLRRDATTYARGDPRIMYLEQEVEKIRRLVIINNPRLLAEQLASLRPHGGDIVLQGSYTGCLGALIIIMKIKCHFL